MSKKIKKGDGLVHAYLLDGKGGGRRLEMPEIKSWTAEQGILWVHFDYTSEAARRWIRKNARLEKVAADALLTEETRPRATAIGDGLLLALRGINLNPGAEPDDMVSVRLWGDNDRLIRHIEDLDAVRERAAVTQEELLSRLSEQMNTRMYVLSMVAAIFLPLGFLTGLLGINVGGIPGAENPWAFLLFLLFIVAIVVAQMLWFRHKKWF